MKTVSIYLLALFLAAASPAWAADREAPASEYTPEDCIACHGPDGEDSSLHISVADYEASAHGAEITCLDCHTGVMDDTHMETEGARTVDCGACHDQENRHGMNGDASSRPACQDCHTRHHILGKADPNSTVHADRLPETCGGCHPVEAGETDFISWFSSFKISSHEKADFSRRYDKDNCLGCHQGKAAHGEETPIDDQDCHRCHGAPDAPGAMWGYMHPKVDAAEQPVTVASAALHQVFLLFLFVLVLGKVLDLIFDNLPGKNTKT